MVKVKLRCSLNLPKFNVADPYHCPIPMYRSTRDNQKNLHSFETAVMMGLGADNGLFVPQLPLFTSVELAELRGKSYLEVFFSVVRGFISTDDIDDGELRTIILKSFELFRRGEATPVENIKQGWVLELFHGPTFAFKDVALQFLGNVFEHFLSKGSKQKRMTILVATSGDTGSAAIYGMSGKSNIDTFVMYPNKKVSLIQELQMTTVHDRHVHCISLQGDFDDAQAVVKASFSDATFRDSVQLGAVNSINTARIIAQITYYFYSWLRVTDHMVAEGEEPIPLNFAVPTGNFGDVLAGYYAKRMGLPIDKLVICTNKNDVLHRFLQTGVYQRQPAAESLAPSMDISVSSNFERYLYHLCGDDSETLTQWMRQFELTGSLQVPEHLLQQVRDDFLSHSCSDGLILETMRDVYSTSQYLACPHTATALAAVLSLSLPPERTVVLATAHPMKFEETVRRALTEEQQGELHRPPEMEAMFSLPRRSILLPNDVEVIKSFVKYNVDC